MKVYRSDIIVRVKRSNQPLVLYTSSNGQNDCRV